MQRILIDTNCLESLRTIERQSGRPIIDSLVEIYLTEAPQYLDKMQQALIEKNFEFIGRSAHSLKSSSGYLGAVAVRDICASIEEVSFDPQLQNIVLIQEKLQTLADVMEGTVEQVSQLASYRGN